MSILSTPPVAAARLRHPALILAVIVACQLMIAIDTSIVTIALPEIQAGLHISTGGLAWIQNAYLLAFGGLVLLGGRAGDILGRRRVFVAGALVFTAGSLLGALATAPWWLLTARAVQGIGGAVAGPSGLALLATTFDGAARVRAFSIFSSVTGAGAAVGMLLGGLLTELMSWRAVFFVVVPVGVAVAVAAPRVLAETERRPGRFDAGGALTGTLGMTALVYGFIGAGADGWRDARTGTAFAAALVLLGLFAAIETRARQPIMPLRLFADRRRAAAYGTQVLVVMAMFGAFYFLTQYLQAGLGYGPLAAGIAFLPMVAAQFGCVRLVPRLLPRFGVGIVAGTGAAFIAAGLLWVAEMTGDGSYAGALLVPFVLMGAGAGLTIAPLNLTVMAGVAAEDAGAASGLAQTMLFGGGALGSAVQLTVYGSHDRFTLAGLGTVFGLGAGFAAAALVLIALLLRGGR